MLRCPRPHEADPYFGLLSAEGPRQGDYWFSEGFPAAAKRDDQRRPADFDGKMHSMSPKRHYFELNVDAAPGDEEGWKGASGMPIFGPGGARVFGLAKEVPLRFKAKKIHAVPAFKLLEDDDFKKLIDYANQSDRRRNFERRLTTIFRRSEHAITFIRDSGNLLRAVDLKPNDKAASVACALLDRKMDEVITGLSDVLEAIFDEIHFDSNDNLTTAADVLIEAVLLIIPYLFDHGVASGVRNQFLNAQATLLEIPCAMPTLAEIVMAAAENRQAEFQPLHGDGQYPDGERQIPPPPEAGINASKEEHEAIRQSLMGKFIPGSWTGVRNTIDDYMFKEFVRSTGGLDRSREERVTQASVELDNRSRRRRYYVVYRMPKGDAARRELRDGLCQLKRDYPALIFLGLTDNLSVDLAERKIYGQLPLILAKKRYKKS